MPARTFTIYEVPNSYVSSGTSPTISGVFTLTVSDDDGFLHATEGLDPGTSQNFTFSGGTVDSYRMYYDDNITIGGGSETIKTFQMTVGGVTRSFVMNDDALTIPGAGVGVSFTLDTYAGYTNLDYNNIPCFTTGTMIETDRGQVPIEMLVVGDRVKTQDNGYQTIRWIGASTLSRRDLVLRKHLCPITFDVGALGPGLPNRRMQVSPQHRMLITGWNVELAFGMDEVFVPAISLVGNPGIWQDMQADGLTYFHMMFDNHEVVFGDGVPSESFLAGETIRNGMDEAQLAEILELFPELAEDHSSQSTRLARPSLRKFEGLALSF